MSSKYFWSLVLLIGLPSCDRLSADEEERILSKARAFDLKNQPDSVLALMRPLAVEGKIVDWYDKLIYCRTEASVGDKELADSLYSTFIAERADSLKGKFILEYLNLLVTERKYPRLTSYSDSLVACCTNDEGLYRDVQMMCYFFKYSAFDDCTKMKETVDSLKALAVVTGERMVSDRAIQEYDLHVQEVCRDSGIEATKPQLPVSLREPCGSKPGVPSRRTNLPVGVFQPKAY